MDEISGIYELCAAHGVCDGDPRRVDELELWELGSALGLAHPADKEPGAGRDPVAERLYAAEHGLPAPRAEHQSAPSPHLAELIPIMGRDRDAS